MADVQCLICGQYFPKGIKFHIRKCHNVDKEKYREMFPGAQILSDKELEEKKNRIHSEKEIQGLIARNKSPKMRNLITERNRDPEFQKKCQAGVTEEVRLGRSKTMKRISLACWNNEEYREGHRAIARETQKRENQKPEVRKRKSELFNKLWENPEFAKKAIEAPKKHPFGVQSTFISQRFHQTFYCRSQGEYEFLQFCENNEDILNVVPGTSCPIPYTSQSITHTYIPDFIVYTKAGQRFIIEIKYEDDCILNYQDKVNGAVDYCQAYGFTYCYINRFSGMKKLKEMGFESVSVLERI